MTVMEWLPSVLVFAVGLVVLLALVGSLLGRLRRTRAVSETMAVAVAGRTTRIRAGLGETRAWRAARQATHDEQADA